MQAQRPCSALPSRASSSPPPAAAPQPPQQQPTQRVIHRPAFALAQFAELVFSQEVSSHPSAFQLVHTPPISATDFIGRLESFLGCSPQTFVVAAGYLRRVFESYRDRFNPQCAHKMVLASLVVAAKFTDDFVYKQAHYAKCGGIDVAEMNLLEREFMNMLGYNAFVSESAFLDACELLLCVQESQAAGAARPQCG